MGRQVRRERVVGKSPAPRTECRPSPAAAPRHHLRPAAQAALHKAQSSKFRDTAGQVKTRFTRFAPRPPPPLQFSIPFETAKTECAARSSCRCCCRCCCWIQHSHGQCARAVLIHPVAPLSPRPRAIASACCGWKRRRRRRRRRRKLTRMRSGPRSGRVGITKAWSAVRSISAPTNSSTTSPQTSNWLRARSEYAQRSSPAFLLRTVSCDRKHWNGVWSVCVHKVEIAPDFSHALKLQF